MMDGTILPRCCKRQDGIKSRPKFMPSSRFWSRKQRPFIDREYFKFSYGDASRGERIIDSQFATRTKYVSTTMAGSETMFGVNFADGRIKGYGLRSPRTRGDKMVIVPGPTEWVGRFLEVEVRDSNGHTLFADAVGEPSQKAGVPPAAAAV